MPPAPVGWYSLIMIYMFDELYTFSLSMVGYQLPNEVDHIFINELNACVFLLSSDCSNDEDILLLLVFGLAL